MPSWDRVHAEIVKAGTRGLPQGQSPYDFVRRKKLRELSKYLERPVVLYAVDCLTPSPKTSALHQLLGPTATMIEPGDKDAFGETIEDLDGEDLAIVLQSAGGFAETVEALVNLLRSKFKRIDFIVPMYAKSAATMFALSGERIYLDAQSELGPIDPQFNIGGSTSPAGGILDQFARAQREITDDPSRLPAWVPILQQYAPSLLTDAQDAWDLAAEMVQGWLEAHMFAGRDDAADRAKTVAKFFSGQETTGDRLRSHARPIGIDRCRELELEIVDLSSEPALQTRVRELHHAVNICIAETGAYKIVENSKGQAFVRQLDLQIQAGPPGGPAPQPQPPPPPAGA